MAKALFDVGRPERAVLRLTLLVRMAKCNM